MRLILLGPPGAGKGTQARDWSRSTAFRSFPPATCCARPLQAETRVGMQGQGGDGCRRAGFRRDRQRDRRRAHRPEADARMASSSTAIRARWRRPMRSSKMLAERGLKLDAVIELVVDDKALVGRIVEARRGSRRPPASRCARTTIPEVVRRAAARILQEDRAADRLLLCQGHAEDVDGMADMDDGDRRRSKRCCRRRPKD